MNNYDKVFSSKRKKNKKISESFLPEETVEEITQENTEIKEVKEVKEYDVTVMVRSLNCRRHPSINAEVITQFQKGKKLTIIEEQKELDNLWGKTTEGWIVLGFCQKVE